MKRTRPGSRATAALLATALGAGVAAGCGSSSAPAGSTSSSATSTSSTTSSSQAPAAASGASAAPKSGAVTVAITNFAYSPATVTVSPGTRITWTNHDSTAHTATAAGGFDTGTINPGRSVSVVVKRPGTYQYICSFHAFMHGTVIVR